MLFSTSGLGADADDVRMRVDTLKSNLEALQENILAYSHHATTPYDFHKESFHKDCRLICDKLKQGKDRLKCLEHCSVPFVPFENMKEYHQRYPESIRELTHPENQELRKAFFMTQHMGSYPSHELDIDQGIQIYAMPLSAVVLPREAWDNFLRQIDRHPLKRQELFEKWKLRQKSFDEPAKHALKRRLLESYAGNRKIRRELESHSIYLE